MADAWKASDLIGVIVAGTANGYILLNMSVTFNRELLPLFLGGIVAYAGAQIILRILKQVLMPSNTATSSFADIFKVSNWPHFIVWGGINGLAFALLLPMVGYSTMAGILLGTATFFASSIFSYLLAF